MPVYCWGSYVVRAHFGSCVADDGADGADCGFDSCYVWPMPELGLEPEPEPGLEPELELEPGLAPVPVPGLELGLELVVGVVDVVDVVGAAGVVGVGVGVVGAVGAALTWISLQEPPPHRHQHQHPHLHPRRQLDPRRLHPCYHL